MRDESDLKKLQDNIKYKFKNERLLMQALTHSSYSNETKASKLDCNERLEFLGDSVLSIAVSEYIYKKYARVPEGDLTKLRASLVCEKSLFEFAKKLSLGSYLILSRGEQNTGGRERPSILSDAFEALIAAIFLDGGMDCAKSFVLSFVEEAIKTQNSGTVFRDYKTTLQEIIQKNPGELIEYIVVSESGPDHNKHFEAEVHLNSNCIGRGSGKSKKEAEQQAAKKALELMGY